MIILIVIKEMKINIVQFINNIFFKLYFLHKKSFIKKTLHCQGLKYVNVGKNTRIDKGCRIDCYKTKYSKPRFIIGNNVSIAFNSTFLISTDLIIDDNVLIASNVFITTENHGINPTYGSYLKQELISKPIFIKNNAWIGENVTILPGVTIGKYSIVGANSVVTKNVPDYSIAVGNPAKIIKHFDFDKNERIQINNN